MTNKSRSILISCQWNQPSSCRAVTCFLCLLFLFELVIKADARSLSPPAQARISSGSISQDGADARPLELGKSITRELKGGQSHLYQVMLAAHQYMQVMVEQRDINLTLVLFGPDGKKLVDANSAQGKQGAEQLTFIAEVAGSYRLEVRPAEKNATPKWYEVKVVALRTPTAEDCALEDARILSAESRSLKQKGEYNEALPLEERALSIREKILGPDHHLVADSLHNLASLYDNKEDYAKAEPLNLRALRIREKTLGPDHPDVAKTLNNLAWIYAVRQDYTKAEVLYRRAFAIQEKALGVDHPDVASTLNDLALLYYEKGDYDQSIQVNERVLDIREKALGPDDDGVGKALNNLALVYEKKGEYAKAESLYQRALLIWEKALGTDHPEIAFAIDNLAKIYFYKGDYAKAEPLFQRALAIREKALGPEHSNTITTINNLANLYLRMGDYAKAEPLFRHAIAAWEKKLGPDGLNVAPPANNLARLYENIGDYEKAEPLYQRALNIREKALGTTHIDVGDSLNNLGQLYLKSRKNDALAEQLLQRSREVLEKAIGPDYPGLAVPLSNLAALSERKGDDAQAERFYRRALAIREKALGPDHLNVAQSLDSLAKLYRRRGETQQALEFSSRSGEIRERNLSHNLLLGSERQKLNYLKLFAEDTDNALSLHIQSAPRDPRALHLALTTLLRRKGRGLDAATDDIALLRSRADAQDQSLFTRLSDARSNLAAMTFRVPDKTNTSSYGSQLKRLEEELEKLEEEMSARSAEFRAQSHPVTLEAVQAAIPKEITLIEFAFYRPNDAQAENQGQPRYAAYVLASQGEARWVDLGEAASIEHAVGEWRQALRDPERVDVNRLARVVDEKVMQPVRTLLGTSRQLLISPDGALNLIPFAALVDEHNSYLVERYTITYLTSGRDLLRLQVPRKSKNPPMVVADPAFGEPAMIASGRAISQNAPGSNVMGGRARVDYSHIFFGPLPGASGEVRALRQLLPQATFLVKEQATEAAVKRVHGPSILHIATHGFFLQDARSAHDDNIQEEGKIKEGMRLGKWGIDVDNPLLRSGLALTGANQVSNGNDDGLLTALEVTGLDLWGTKLVVLSACDTGVGKVKNGDGVYGLRRALVLAGAESQTISLWPVSDRSTRDLMIGYYKGLMQGQGRGEALRQVQLQILQSKAHTHPYYWASFIHSGAWNNLEGR